jgi:hypothetical protein
MAGPGVQVGGEDNYVKIGSIALTAPIFSAPLIDGHLLPSLVVIIPLHRGIPSCPAGTPSDSAQLKHSPPSQPRAKPIGDWREHSNLPYLIAAESWPHIIGTAGRRVSELCREESVNNIREWASRTRNRQAWRKYKSHSRLPWMIYTLAVTLAILTMKLRMIRNGNECNNTLRVSMLRNWTALSALHYLITVLTAAH